MKFVHVLKFGIEKNNNKLFITREYRLQNLPEQSFLQIFIQNPINISFITKKNWSFKKHFVIC